MASETNVQLRLAWYARWLLVTAAVMARLHMRLPRRLVKYVVDHSWQLRFGHGPWVRGRLDSRGRLHA